MVLRVGKREFQSTAGQSSRQPVNTFVEPVSVLPKTGMMELADTLSSINPTLQKIVNFKINEAKSEGILEGQNQILGSTPTQINKIKKELEAKEGKRFARNFIGGNIYTQYGIEKQIALNLSNSSKAKTKKFFDEYVVPRGSFLLLSSPFCRFRRVVSSAPRFRKVFPDFSLVSSPLRP